MSHSFNQNVVKLYGSHQYLKQKQSNRLNNFGLSWSVKQNSFNPVLETFFKTGMDSADLYFFDCLPVIFGTVGAIIFNFIFDNRKKCDLANFFKLLTLFRIFLIFGRIQICWILLKLCVFGALYIQNDVEFPNHTVKSISANKQHKYTHNGSKNQ